MKIYLIKKFGDKIEYALVSSGSIACSGIKENVLLAAGRLVRELGHSITLRYINTIYSDNIYLESFINFRRTESPLFIRTGLSAGVKCIDISSYEDGYYILGNGNEFGVIKSFSVEFLLKRNGKLVTNVYYSLNES